jgi:Transglutaminase-like superfamily
MDLTTTKKKTRITRMNPIRLSSVKVSDKPLDQIRKTIKLIGQAIQGGSVHLPIRNHAAALATTAGPKDYVGQVNAIFSDFVKNWRYVKDPVDNELIVTSPDAIYNLIIGGGKNSPGIGRGKGAGDCDDATVALGSMLQSIGIPVRIAVTAPPGFPAGPFFTHVFAQASIPGLGWISVDPVPWPKHTLGYTPQNSRIAFFNLDGKLIGYNGNVQGLQFFGNPEVIAMNIGPQTMSTLGSIPDIRYWQDIGLAGTDDDQEPLDWRKYVLRDFGRYAGSVGILSGEGLGLAAEVEYWQEPGGRLIARTPMLELAPQDYLYVKQNRAAYDGMLALGDDGTVYRYDGLAGWFKKLFKKAKSFVKKIGKGVKKLIKKIPGGKYLVKIGEKIFSIANKFVKPLVKFVGKYAAKLAPVAALIPGYGPAIAAGLYTAGKVANLMTKYGVELIGQKGKARNLKFKSGDSAKQFQKELKQAAEKQKKEQKSAERAKKTRITRSRAVVRTRRQPFTARGQRAAMAYR